MSSGSGDGKGEGKSELDAARPGAGGVVFRAGGELWFLPASIAMKVMPIPEMAEVPGGPVELRGVALVDGNMIPVVDALDEPWERLEQRTAPLSSHKEAMLVCAVLGETLGLVGIDVVATGRFEQGESAGEVKHDTETARTFDVAALVARVREGRWAV